MRVEFGNPAPHEVLSHDDVERRGLDPAEFERHDEGKVRVPVDADGAVTVFDVPADRSIRDAFLEVTHAWDYHCAVAPSWVASDSQGLASLLAEQYGCDVAELQAVEG